jgi:hypothetical protein
MHPTRRQLLSGALAAFAAAVALPARADGGSTFRRIYGDPALRKRFFPFLVNVFHLVPEDALDALIAECVAAHPDDPSIYRAIVDGLPAITPFAATLRYAIPALRVQKRVLGDQTAQLLGPDAEVDGYLELGTVGTYIEPLKQRVTVRGPVVLVTDAEPGYGPAEIAQRGTLRPNASYVPLGNYDPIPREAVPDASLDLATSYIGFHHAPLDRLEGIVESVHRVLRPGGKLIVREHDVVDDDIHEIVALAHDVFNAGTYVTVDRNEAELRHFRSVEAWTTFYDGFGLRRAEGHALQDGDPTDNALVCFVKA